MSMQLSIIINNTVGKGNAFIYTYIHTSCVSSAILEYGSNFFDPCKLLNKIKKMMM